MKTFSIIAAALVALAPQVALADDLSFLDGLPSCFKECGIQITQKVCGDDSSTESCFCKKVSASEESSIQHYIQTLSSCQRAEETCSASDLKAVIKDSKKICSGGGTNGAGFTAPNLALAAGVAGVALFL